MAIQDIRQHIIGRTVVVDTLLLFILTDCLCSEYLSKLQPQQRRQFNRQFCVSVRKAGGVDAEATVSNAGFEIR